MPPLRLLIVDDEPPAVELLVSLTAKVSGFEVAATAHDVQSAFKIIQGETIDLVLLDIAMPGQDGFALIEQVGIEQMPFVIFVTAHPHHAVRAFDVRALDYLLKPPTVARFTASLTRAADLIQTRPPRERQPRLRELLHTLERTAGAPPSPAEQAGGQHPQKFVRQVIIKTRDGFEQIPVESIIWCEAEDHYVRIHTNQKSHLYTGNLSSLHQQLDPAEFARVRRDAIIRYGAIESVRTASFGTLQLVLTKQHRLITSRTLEAEIKLRCLAQSKGVRK